MPPIRGGINLMKKQGISALGAIVLGLAVVVFIGLTIIRPLVIGEAARATITPTADRGTPLVGIIAVTPTLPLTEVLRCNTETCLPPPTLVNTGVIPTEPRSLPTRDPAATPIEAFQVIDQQMWPAEGDFIDWTQPLMFGQYIRFATPTDVELYLIAFPIYADERVPTPNGCYADDARIPTGDYPDRPFWSDGVTIPYSYGVNEFEHVYQYTSGDFDAAYLISWLVVRGEQSAIVYCSQQVIELPRSNG
jgi:hypothetical protein